MQRYKVQKVDVDAAELIWSHCEQKSLWNRPYFLNLVAEIDFWCVFKGLEPIAIWPIQFSGKRIPFSYYIGPLISSRVQNSEKSEPDWNLKAVIYVYLDKLIHFYDYLEFSVNKEFDLRPFIWWINENAKKYNLNIAPKYSATLKLKNNIMEIRQNYRKDKKKTLRKLYSRNDIIFDDCITEGELLKVYNEIVPSSGGNEKKIEQTMARILSGVRIGYGKTYAIRDKVSRELLAVQLTIEDSVELHYIFGGSIKRERENSLQVLLIDHIHELNANFKKEVTIDFNGANSSNGFDDKASYGSEPKMYFDLTLTKK